MTSDFTPELTEKAQMEYIWSRPGVSDPLRTAGWRIGFGGRLTPDYGSRDRDESDD